MMFPNKWRETIDPFTLNFKNFILKEILGYPHAGNDVFYAKGIYNNKEIYAFIKVNRQTGADVRNEIEVLNKIHIEKTPQIIDYDAEMTYRVSIALKGERLSTIVDCDRILVIDQGRVVAEGKHKNLITNCKIYKNLFKDINKKIRL